MIYNIINVSNMSAMFGQLEAALHSPSQSRLLGFCTASTSLPQGYLWVSLSFHCSENIFFIQYSPAPMWICMFECIIQCGFCFMSV